MCGRLVHPNVVHIIGHLHVEHCLERILSFVLHRHRHGQFLSAAHHVLVHIAESGVKTGDSNSQFNLQFGVQFKVGLANVVSATVFANKHLLGEAGWGNVVDHWR